MKICVLCDSYGENETMNGSVSHKLINELNILGHETYIIRLNEKRDETEKNVYSVPSYNMICTDYFMKKVSIARYSILWKYALKIKKVISFINRNIYINGLDKKLSKKVYKKIDYLNNREKFDMVIAIAYPFELFDAAIIFKQNNLNVKVVLYQIDLYTSVVESMLTDFLLKRRKKSRTQDVIRYSNVCDLLVTLEFIKDQEYGWCDEQILSVNLPLITEMNFDLPNNTKTVLTYTGSLNLSERSPKMFLDFMDDFLEKNKDIVLNFYYRGDVGDLIKKSSGKHKGCINDFGTVSSVMAEFARKQSDILISIGTLQGNQIAGKTFEYISTGKPILYLYFKENDKNKLIFDDYPLALCINLMSVVQSEFNKELSQFISITKGKYVPVCEIIKKYKEYTPNYITNQIIDGVYKTQ